MSLKSRARDLVRSVEFGTKWLLINIYGPADQDRSIDPVEQLRREYGRRRRT